MRSWIPFASLLSAAIGIIFFAYQNNIILIRPFHRAHLPTSTQHKTKQSIRFTFFKHMQPCTEQRTILWDQTHDIHNVTRIIHAYWMLLEEEHIIPGKIPVQVVTTDSNQSMLICSIGMSPFAQHQNTYANWLIIEGLLKTIRDHIPRYQSFLLLINHQSYKEYTISSHQAWPLEGFMNTWITQKAPYTPELPKKMQYTLILDPAGDAQTPGRMIDTMCERALTLSWAERLKQELTAQYPHIRVLLTRSLRDSLEPLQNASFANRIQADLYIHLSLFSTQQSSPELYFYTHRLHPTSDLWKRSEKPGNFIPYYCAHQTAAQLSTAYAQQLYTQLMAHPLCTATMRGVYSLPYKPLIGMTGPALGIEMGIHANGRWQEVVDPLVEVIAHVLETTEVTESIDISEKATFVL